MPRLLLHAVAAALLAATLVGCGDDDTTETSSAPSTPVASQESGTPSASATATPSRKPKPKPTIPADAPRCSEVWVEGATLAGGYRGCVTGEGKRRSYVKAAVLGCSSGQGIVRFDDRFWAVRGGTISAAAKLVESDEYLAAVARCRG